MKKLTLLESKLEIIEYLRALGDGEIDDAYNLSVYHLLARDFNIFTKYKIDVILPDWELFSGSYLFPVPAPADHVSKNGYPPVILALMYLPKWRENEYADNWRTLAHFIADTLEECL